MKLWKLCMHKSASNKSRCAGIIKRERKKSKTIHLIGATLYIFIQLQLNVQNLIPVKKFFFVFIACDIMSITHILFQRLSILKKINQSKIACFVATLKRMHTILYINRIKQIVKRFALACIKTKEHHPKQGALIAKCHSKAKNIR